MGTQLMEDLLEIGVKSQVLPFKGGNVYGKANCFEKFLQLCKTMGTQLMEDLLEIGVKSQVLPFKGGNVYGKANW
ncbi:hypothetical protein Glove_236g64 [Diversispora epigaea]|uniref:Uncharacterized protein n=1 Tax=Diversispora epigaea TaxID=1348612 RepID=A0A397IDG0_9GLOM|nr:hypothetical protein Glove_236g64 [Diversispora epigaea]